MEMKRLILAGVLAALLVGQTAVAENSYGVPDDYAGLSPNKAALINVSELQAMQAIYYYRKFHEAWPSAWSDVVASGLFTADLLTPVGQVIDPDDHRIDFDQDIQFSPRANGESPRLVVFRAGSGRNFLYVDMPTGGATISEALAFLAGHSTPSMPRNVLEVNADNPDWIKAYAVGCMINNMLIMAVTYHPKTINSWDSFVRSGFYTQSAESLNPLTGAPWSAGGGAGELIWCEGDGPGRPPHLKLVDPASGQLVSLRL